VAAKAAKGLDGDATTVMMPHLPEAGRMARASAIP
jgi:hypothetical protein